MLLETNAEIEVNESKDSKVTNDEEKIIINEIVEIVEYGPGIFQKLREQDGITNEDI